MTTEEMPPELLARLDAAAACDEASDECQGEVQNRGVREESGRKVLIRLCDHHAG